MRRIFIIRDLRGEKIGSLSPVGGDPYWHCIQDIVAEHFRCDVDDVCSLEPPEDRPDDLEQLTIDGTPVATIECEWRQ